MTRRCCSLACFLVLAACGGSPRLDLRFHAAGIELDALARVTTVIDIDPARDPRSFAEVVEDHSGERGVTYSVRAVDDSGRYKLVVTQQRSLGYTFAPDFALSLLPPVSGAPPPLLIRASAFAPSGEPIAGTATLPATFDQEAALDLYLDPPGGPSRCGDILCADGEACCRGACTSLAGDRADCGACDHSCGAAESCVAGVCRCEGGSQCTASESCCPGLGCVDTSSDAFRCGSCDRACNLGEMCSQGNCGCGSGPACSAGTKCCGDACAVDGKCPCGAAVCEGNQICCGGDHCADLTSARDDCGKCGTRCADPALCDGAACRCASAGGNIQCTGQDVCCIGAGCRNLSDDAQACGACGVQCGGATSACCGATCVDLQHDASACGACGVQCGTGRLCCNGMCTNQGASPLPCGSCSKTCVDGELCSAGGACACNGNGTCAASQTCCPTVGCTDLSNGVGPCGACGSPACDPGFACQGGTCVQTTCVPACDPLAGSCQGTACKCGSGPACNLAAGERCCANACVNLNSNPNHCGACAQQCSVGTGTHASSASCHTMSCSFVCMGGWQDCDPGSPPNLNGCESACPCGQLVHSTAFMATYCSASPLNTHSESDAMAAAETTRILTDGTCPAASLVICPYPVYGSSSDCYQLSCSGTLWTWCYTGPRLGQAAMTPDSDTYNGCPQGGNAVNWN